MLRACHRVLKPKGRIAYYTIYIAPDLIEPGYRRAVKFWPEAATTRRHPAEMLESAGFVDVHETDVTKQYQATARGWLEGRRRYYDDLKQALGKAALTEKIQEGEETLQAVKDGLLRRSLLVGRRPA